MSKKSLDLTPQAPSLKGRETLTLHPLPGREREGVRVGEGLGERFEPRIVAFFCTWCTYTAADLAGISRMVYAPNARIVRFMCSGRVDPQFVLKAFQEGADGVLIGGCHPGDCHYQSGNYKALRRFTLLKRLLKEMGIEEERFRLEWISASEGDRVQRVMNEMAEKIKRLGPLHLERAPKPHRESPLPQPLPYPHPLPLPTRERVQGEGSPSRVGKGTQGLGGSR